MDLPLRQLVENNAFLGALSWYYRNPERLVDDFPDGLITIDPVIIRMTGVDLRSLEELGQAARQSGCTIVRWSDIQVDAGTGEAHRIHHIIGFPRASIATGWHVDGTHNRSDDDQKSRMLLGPEWSQQSCAIDSVLTLFLQLDAGRTRADQVWDGLFRSANEPSKLLLLVIRKPWSYQTAGGRRRLRDILRRALEGVNPTLYPSTDRSEVAEMLLDLGQCVPQIMATWTDMVRCCPAGPWHGRCDEQGRLLSRREVGILIPPSAPPDWLFGASSASARLQRFFDARPLADHEALQVQSCNRPGCRPQSTAYQQSVVLDRIPPTLLFPDGIQTYDGDHWGTLGPLELRYHVYADGLAVERSRTYAFFGCILHRQDHFVTVINRLARNGGSELHLYDGMASAKLSRLHGSLESWMKRRGHGVAALVYVQVASLSEASIS